MNSLLDTMVNIVNTHHALSTGGEMTFGTDLQVGKDAEQKTLEVIREKYPLAFGIDGNHKAYDIFIPELDAGVEVKSDLQTEATGNVMVEISWRGKPSGLMATRAKYWVYCIVYGIGINRVWIKPERIKDLIVESEHLSLRTFVPKNETGIVQGYLIPIKTFEKYSMRNQDDYTEY